MEATLNIVNRTTDSLIPYARNPRKNDAVVDQMVASIREFGFKIPVLAKSDGSVIDGHLRLKAAQRLGIEEVPVILCDDWTDWDDALLKLEIEDLKAFDYDLSLTGFDSTELEKLMRPAFDEQAENATP